MHRVITTLLLLAGAGLGFAQESRPTSQPAEPPASQPTKEAEPKRSPLPPLGHPAGVFGDGVALKAATSLDAAAKNLKEVHGRPIRLEGVLKDVCRKKGCWTILRDGKREIRVRFRDYSFFVPRDAQGRQAIVQGIISSKTISEEMAKHYAEEGGNPAEAEKIKGPQQVLAFMATGVEILGKAALPPKAEAAAPEALNALQAKLAAGRLVRHKETKPVEDLKAALALLRRLKGPRTVEFNLCAEVDGWFVFSSSKRAFESGYAVKQDSTVKGF